MCGCVPSTMVAQGVMIVKLAHHAHTYRHHDRVPVLGEAPGSHIVGDLGTIRIRWYLDNRSPNAPEQLAAVLRHRYLFVEDLDGHGLNAHVASCWRPLAKRCRLSTVIRYPSAPNHAASAPSRP